jgi:predicted NBD/HSP70 family sugar kinase
MHGHNATTMKRLNRGTVLRLLLRGGPLSRRQIARATGLRTSTISYIVAELLAAGLVQEVATNGAPARAARPGRQEIPLALAPDGAYAVGVHVGIFGAQVALTNARAEIVAQQRELLPTPPAVPAVVAQIGRLINGLIIRAGIERARLIGVGVGVLAYVEPEQGLVRLAPSLGWHDVPLAALLRGALDLPVFLEHNVRAMALAEQLFGRWGDLRDFAFLNVGTGIGAALVVNGQLVQGHAHDAGQLGHLPVAPDGPLCACGKRGCLDAVASMQAVRERATALCQRHPDSPLARRLAAHPVLGRENRVLEMAAAGDPLARQSIEPGTEYLAGAVAHLLALLDPEAVIISAGASRYDHVLIPPLQQALTTRAALPGVAARLVPSSFGRDQAIVGGAAIALQRLFASPDMLPSLIRPAALAGTLSVADA